MHVTLTPACNYSFRSYLYGCWLLLGPVEIKLFPHSIWCLSQCPRIGSSMLYYCQLYVSQTSLMAKIASDWVCRFKGAPLNFFGNAQGHNSTIVLFQTDYSIFYLFLLQTCFRSTFILLTPSRFRIIYLGQMLEFLPQSYSTWCWTTSNITTFHSFISQVLLLQSWSPRMDERWYGENL
jgi:hypothetical protein